MQKTIAEINHYTSVTVNPLTSPDKTYELYSVPSYDSSYPEIIQGKEIGSTKVAVKENDVLVCKINPRINRVWVVKHHTKHSLIASSEWIVIRSPENDCDYLKWYFISPTFQKMMVSQVTGIGGSLTRAQPKQVATYPVPLPDLPTQRRIAATLDKVSEGIELCRKMLGDLDEVVKARFVEMFGDAEHTAYEVSTVGKECTLKSGTTFSSDVEQAEGEYKYAKVSDMNLPGNEVYIKSSKAYVSTDTAGKTPIPAGAVIFPKRGGAIGTNKKRILVEDTCVDLNTMGVIPGARIITEYLYGFFIGMDLMSIADGSTIPQLNNRQIAPLALVVPPLEEQNRFAAFFNQADKSKSAIQQQLSALETLKKSLMQKYFG